MYDLINNIINHSYQSNYSGEQSYIYNICGALILLLTVVFIDLVYRFFVRIFRKL